MKRLSRTIMTAMLVALLAFSLVGCKSTAKVEPIPPAPVVEPAPEPIVPVVVPKAVEKPVEPAPAPVVEKVVEPAKPVAPVKVAPVVAKPALPYGVKEIVKSDGAKKFDLFIVHTNDLNGNIYAQNGGIGVARLSTMANAGKAITDNWLMLNAGNVGDV
ncbi:MAG: bifunctional metallophosphatase/5'-nucleotidase, partial [Spirochaetia bacterium]|nr:bifunctional metallophosphatase/5'-nucleotidase [Spirochaetia bacterium]